MNNIYLPGKNLPQNPIFIVGYPRSGTTLLQMLLVSHTNILSFPETHYFSIIEKNILYDEKQYIVPSCLEKVFDKIYQKTELRFSDEEQKFIYKLSESRKMTSKKLFEYIVVHFLKRQQSDISEQRNFRWLEKTPTHANFLPRIKELYPEAQIIHIVRHPVPAIFSRKLKFPFNKDTPLDQLARSWNRLQQNVQHFKNIRPGSIFITKYENLVADPEHELAAISSYLNLTFNGKQISNYTRKAALKNEFVDSLTTSRESWKKEDLQKRLSNKNIDYDKKINRADAESIESIVRENMKKYGYHPYFDKKII